MKPPIFKKVQYLRISQITAIVGFVAILLLSIGLENLKFKPGVPLVTETGKLPLLSIGRGLQGSWLLNLFLISIIAMFPLALILLIFSSEARRIFKKYSRALIVWFFFLLGFRLYVLLFKNEETTVLNSSNGSDLPAVLDPPNLPATETIATIDRYNPPEILGWQSFLIGFIIAMILGLLVYFLWIRNHQEDDELKTIALKTLTNIREGRQWEDAIIQCYAQMNTYIQRQKSINRKSFLTPAEFARELTAAGLPSEPVEKLTGLFEYARYSRGITHDKDATEAIHCLNVITQALEVTE